MYIYAFISPLENYTKQTRHGRPAGLGQTDSPGLGKMVTYPWDGTLTTRNMEFFMEGCGRFQYTYNTEV